MHTLPNKEPAAIAVEVNRDTLSVHLQDGRSVLVPVEWFPKLRDATLEEKDSWRLIGGGMGIHWDLLDEDISVKGLLMPEYTLAMRHSA
jgi:hypothetical protein